MHREIEHVHRLDQRAARCAHELLPDVRVRVVRRETERERREERDEHAVLVLRPRGGEPSSVGHTRRHSATLVPARARREAAADTGSSSTSRVGLDSPLGGDATLPRVDDKIAIGPFARLCRLSVKALRHYDELGLLTPAHVDPKSGYRSYRRSQLRRALAIAMLRGLDVPLAGVREILDGGGPRAALALAAEARRQARELARRRMVLASLERLVRDRTLSPYEIEVVDAPARQVALTRRTASLDEQEIVTTTAIRELMAALEGQWTDPVVCRFPEARESPDDIALEIGVGLREAAMAPASATITELPAGREACARHIGPYASLGLAHHDLFAWARERGEAESGPIYEIYVNDPDEVAPEDLVTEVRLPLMTTT